MLGFADDPAGCQSFLSNLLASGSLALVFCGSMTILYIPYLYSGHARSSANRLLFWLSNDRMIKRHEVMNKHFFILILKMIERPLLLDRQEIYHSFLILLFLGRLACRKHASCVPTYACSMSRIELRKNTICLFMHILTHQICCSLMSVCTAALSTQLMIQSC